MAAITLFGQSHVSMCASRNALCRFCWLPWPICSTPMQSPFRIWQALYRQQMSVAIAGQPLSPKLRLVHCIRRKCLCRCNDRHRQHRHDRHSGSRHWPRGSFRWAKTAKLGVDDPNPDENRINRSDKTDRIVSVKPKAPARAFNAGSMFEKISMITTP